MSPALRLRVWVSRLTQQDKSPIRFAVHAVPHSVCSAEWGTLLSEKLILFDLRRQDLYFGELVPARSRFYIDFEWYG